MRYIKTFENYSEQSDILKPEDLKNPNSSAMQDLMAELSAEMGLKKDEVKKSIEVTLDKTEKPVMNEELFGGVETWGAEAIAGASLLAGGFIGSIIGYAKWETNANLREYVNAEARRIVTKELKEKNLDETQVTAEDMKELVKMAVDALKKDPEFMKRAEEAVQ